MVMAYSETINLQLLVGRLLKGSMASSKDIKGI